MALVRRALLKDAAGVAAVHVLSWQATYGGILPEAYLAERSVAVRTAFWSDVLAKDDPAVCVFVACLADGSVCGFASGGPERTGTLGVNGELYSVYVLETAQGLGLGRLLLETVLAELGGKVGVRVLAVNPARGFYEHLGGRWLAETQVQMGGKSFMEVAYVF